MLITIGVNKIGKLRTENKQPTWMNIANQSQCKGSTQHIKTATYTTKWVDPIFSDHLNFKLKKQLYIVYG
jgi:hypothetical protein